VRKESIQIQENQPKRLIFLSCLTLYSLKVESSMANKENILKQYLEIVMVLIT